MTKKPNRKRSRKPEASATTELQWLLAEYSRLAKHFSASGDEPDVEAFKLWSGRAMEAARFLLPHQVPRLSTSMPIPPPETEQTTQRFTLRVFDHGIDVTELSTADLTRYYRACVAAGPGVDPGFVPSDPPALPAPSVPDAAPSVHVPEAASMPVIDRAPVELEEPVVEPEPAETEPVSRPAAEPPPNVVKFPEPSKSIDEEYLRGLTSAVGEDGKPRFVAPPSRPPYPGPRWVPGRRTSGVFDPWR